MNMYRKFNDSPAVDTITLAYQDIIQNETNWMLLHYANDNYDDLVFYASGYDGLEELKTKIYDLNRVFVAFYRMETESGPGYALLNYIPPCISGVKRARALVHSRRIGVILQKHQAVLTVETLSQLTSKSIYKALADPSYTTPSPIEHSFSHSPMSTSFSTFNASTASFASGHPSTYHTQSSTYNVHSSTSTPFDIQPNTYNHPSTLYPIAGRQTQPTNLEMPRRSYSETYSPGHNRIALQEPPQKSMGSRFVGSLLGRRKKEATVDVVPGREYGEQGYGRQTYGGQGYSSQGYGWQRQYRAQQQHFGGLHYGPDEEEDDVPPPIPPKDLPPIPKIKPPSPPRTPSPPTEQYQHQYQPPRQVTQIFYDSGSETESDRETPSPPPPPQTIPPLPPSSSTLNVTPPSRPSTSSLPSVGSSDLQHFSRASPAPQPPSKVSPTKMLPVVKQKSAPPPRLNKNREPSPSLDEEFAVISPFELDGYSFGEAMGSMRPTAVSPGLSVRQKDTFAAASHAMEFRTASLPRKWAISRENLLSDPEERERRRMERLRQREEEEKALLEEEQRAQERKRQEKEEMLKKEEEEERRRQAELKEQLRKITLEKERQRRLEQEEEERKRREIEERKRLDRERRIGEHHKLEKWRKEQDRIREQEARKAALEKKKEEEERLKKIEKAEKEVVKNVKGKSEAALTGWVTIQFPDSLFWKRRYFKFVDDTLNLYRSAKHMATPMESIPLRGQIKALKEWSDGYEDLEAIPFSFVIEFNDRTWSLYADSEDDKFRVLGLLKHNSGL